MKYPTISEISRRVNRQAAVFYVLYEQAKEDRYAYSVSVFDAVGNHSSAEDVTDNRQAAERFLEVLCREGVEPCHLHDLLEDTLPLH